MTILSLLVVLISTHYLAFDSTTYFEQQREVFIRREVVLGIHICGALLALITGPWQFARSIRNRWPRVHRITGRAYVLGCLVGGVGGLALATTAHGGWVTSLGFAGLAIAWLGTTVVAFAMIRVRRVAEHKKWMIRSFSLTFAAVTLRLMLGAYEGFELDIAFADAYSAIAWLCWVPNLAVAWWFTRSRQPLLLARAAERP
ncbi:membrane protein, putative [Alloactinosynnema sp. L-07]|nr:membrane protein, putative [Alloactinosynnema sp. L-07]